MAFQLYDRFSARLRLSLSASVSSGSFPFVSFVLVVVNQVLPRLLSSTPSSSSSSSSSSFRATKFSSTTPVFALLVRVWEVIHLRQLPHRSRHLFSPSFSRLLLLLLRRRARPAVILIARARERERGNTPGTARSYTLFSLFTHPKRKEREHAPALIFACVCEPLPTTPGWSRSWSLWERWWERENPRERERAVGPVYAYYGTNQSINHHHHHRKKKKREEERGENSFFF